VRISVEDTIETLTAKVHAAEHLLLPSVIAKMSQNMEASR